MLPSCLNLVSPWDGSTPTLSCDLSFKAPNSWFVFPLSFSRSNGNWREIMLWPRNTPCALETQWCDHLLRLAVRGVCLETQWRDTLLRLTVRGVFLVHIAGTKGAPWTGRAQEWEAPGVGKVDFTWLQRWLAHGSRGRVCGLTFHDKLAPIKRKHGFLFSQTFSLMAR